MENFNKVITAVLATLITSFIIGGLLLYGKFSSLESTMTLRVDYLEKRYDDCVTQDRLENAKLQIGQQITAQYKQSN